MLIIHATTPLNARFEQDSTEAMLRSGDGAQGVAANDNFLRIAATNNKKRASL